MLYMFFAQGFEEVEAIATLDVIRRSGIDIKSVGVCGTEITGSHNITIKCDITDSEVSTAGIDGIILPGGMPGTTNLLNSETVNSVIDFCYSNDKLVSAICAAPLILGRKGILEGKKAVCFPGFENELKGRIETDSFFVTDGNVITAKGMGSAVNFGLEIVAYFNGRDASEKLKSTLQCS